MLLNPGTLGGVDSGCHAEVKGLEEEAGGLGVQRVQRTGERMWQVQLFHL